MTNLTDEEVKRMREWHERYRYKESGNYKFGDSSHNYIIDQLLADRERLVAENERLRAKFEHIHVNNGLNDTCLKCGLDLRDPIHKRFQP